MLSLLKRSVVARRLLLARLLSVWGDTFYAMAAMWITLEVTGSAWRMALIALAEVLPYLLFSAVAGALVDRWDAKRVLVLLDLAQAAVVAAIPVLYLSGLFSPWFLPAVGFLLATCRTLYGPAITAYYSGCVPKEDMAALLGLQTAAFRSGSIVVPLLLGAFFAHINLVPAFLLDGLSFVLSAALVASLPAPAPGDGKVQRSRPSLGRDLRQGWKTLAARRLLLLAMLTGTLGSVVRSPIYRFALPLLATGPLQAGESGYKILSFAQGIGGVAGALLSGWLVTRSRSYLQTTLAGWSLSGFGTLLAGLSPLLLGRLGLIPASAGLIFSAMGSPIAYTAVGVFLQTDVPRDHIGKVSGLYGTLDMSGDYGGVLLMPLLMTWFSTESILASGGLLTMLFCAIVAVWVLRPVSAASGAGAAAER
jgi:MFS family permease